MKSAQLQVRWTRVCGIYFALAIVCLIVGVSTAAVHDVFVTIGVFMVAAFIPLLMVIFFLRGILRVN